LVGSAEDAVVPGLEGDEVAVDAADGLGDDVDRGEDDGAEEMDHAMLRVRDRLDPTECLVRLLHSDEYRASDDDGGEAVEGDHDGADEAEVPPEGEVDAPQSEQLDGTLNEAEGNGHRQREDD
jgi:hypothetical protein